jgi:hypothetical protein
MIKWIKVDKDKPEDMPVDYAYKGVKSPIILFCLYEKYIHGGYFIDGKFTDTETDNWYEIEEVSHWAEANLP